MASSTSPRGSRSRAGRATGRGPTRPGTRPGAQSTSQAKSQSGSRPPREASRPVAATGPRPRSRFTGRAAVLVLVVVVLGISYASSLRASLRQHSQLDALHANIRHAKAEIAAAQREKERWRDPHYVEAQARARFGWVMPGEIGFQVIDRNGKLMDNPTSLPTVRPEARARPSTWYQSAWGSVVAAGNPPTPAADQPTPVMKIRLHDHRR